MASEEFCYLALDRLKPSKHNPRKTFDADRLVELKESIKRDGIITPLIVRPGFGLINSEHRFEILAGERRFRMATELGLKEVPVRIRADLSDEQALELMIVENLQREDVHELEEAEGFKALLDSDQEQDVESLAAKCGKSASYVYQRLKLCELIAPAKKAFINGEITAGHAIEIARLTEPDQKLALAACFRREWGEGKNLQVLEPVRELRRWIAQEVHLDLSLAAFPKGEPNLYKEAGACTACPKNTAVAKELFADNAKKETCTDRACFMRKGLAFERSMREQLLADKTKFVEIDIREYWHNDKPAPGVLKSNEYEKVGAARCDSTVKGLVVGETAARGSILDVCTDRKCKRHLGKYGAGGAATRGASEAQKREAKLEALKQKATSIARQKTLDLIVKKAGANSKGSLLTIAEQVFTGINDFADLYERRGWPEPKQKKWGMPAYGADLNARLAKLPEKELLAELVELALSDEVERGHYHRDDTDPLLEAAARFKVQPVKPEAVKLPDPPKPKNQKPAKKKLAASLKKAGTSGGLTALGKRNLEKLKKKLEVKRVENPRDSVSLAKSIRSEAPTAEASA